MLVDHDELGPEGCVSELENANFPNHWSGPQVMSLDEVEIGEWDDDHDSNGPGRKEWFLKAFE